MTGYRNKLKKNFFLNSYSEAGVAMVEFAFVLPVLIFLAFSGYNLIRMMEVEMLKKDFSRSLALSHMCSFKQGGAVAECYKEAIKNISAYESTKNVLKNSDSNIKFYYSAHTYALVDPVQGRSFNNCNDNLKQGLVVNYVGGYDGKGIPGSEFPNRHYDIESVQARAGYTAGNPNPITLAILFDTPGVVSGQREACFNGMITIVEVQFELKKFFNYGFGSSQHFYDISYI